MRAVQRQPISLLDSWPAPDTDAVRQALREFPALSGAAGGTAPL